MAGVEISVSPENHGSHPGRAWPVWALRAYCTWPIDPAVTASWPWITPTDRVAATPLTGVGSVPVLWARTYHCCWPNWLSARYPPAVGADEFPKPT